MSKYENIDPDTWAVALRGLLGYPLTNPARRLILVVGGRLDHAGVFHHCNIARELDRHMLRVEIADNGIPVAIQMAIRGDETVTWYPNCVAYAASDTPPLAIMTNIESWGLDTDLALRPSHLPPVQERMEGVVRAMHRWDAAAYALGPVELDGTVFVPNGKSYSDGVPVKPRHGI